MWVCLGLGLRNLLMAVSVLCMWLSEVSAMLCTVSSIFTDGFLPGALSYISEKILQLLESPTAQRMSDSE